jgi:N-acylneuraminate cytidylyltransferase
MRLAVIPARGGSKRIPRKNVKPFCGKPIICWSIEAAIASACFDHVVVSTDDDGVAEVARAAGAEVPFVRPAALGGDLTATRPVIQHAIRWYREHGDPADEVCCIYATAPFIGVVDIRRGLATLLENDCRYAFSVASFTYPIQRALKLDAVGRVAMFHPEHFRARSQDLEEAHHDAGQFYWGYADAWLRDEPTFGPYARAVVLPRHRVQDIDTPEDWVRAEWLFRAMQADDGASDGHERAVGHCAQPRSRGTRP